MSPLERPTEALRYLLCALAVSGAACGDGPTAPVDADISGVWDYAITDARGENVFGICSIDNITIALTGTTAAPVGTVTAGGELNLACVSDSTVLREVAGTADLEGISVNGTSVAFQFPALPSDALSATTPFVHTGSVVTGGDTMTGTVTFAMRFASPNGTVTRAFTGTWTATRQ